MGENPYAKSQIKICPLDIIRDIELNMERKDFEVQHKTHGYLYKMPELIDTMCKRLEKLHKDDHVIFFLDEIMAFGNPYSLDWTNLTPGA